MSLEETINQEIKTSLRNKDEVALRGLRAIKAEILLFKTSKNANTELFEEDEIKILNKLSKQRKDSLEIYKNNNREDLMKKEEEEINVIKKFLPKQLSEKELTTFITDFLQKNNFNSIKDMGKAIGMVNKELMGKADGKVIADSIKKILS